MEGSDFDADKFAERLFERERVAAAREQHAALGAQRDAAARKLKEDAFRNYQRFLASSRATASLEGDLERVRELFSAVGAVLDRLQDAALDLPLPASAPAAPIAAASVAAPDAAADSELERDVDWLCGVPEAVALALAQRRLADAADVLVQAGAVFRKRARLLQAARGTQLGAELVAAHRALAGALADDVAALVTSPLLLQPQARDAVKLLVQLGLAERAKTVFLHSRAVQLHKASAHVRFEGDIVRYVGELSLTCVAGVATTISDFSAAFPDGQDVSRLSQWASDELLRFADSFRKRVFYSEDFSIVGEAIHIALFHCSILLPPGFDLSFLLTRSFLPSVRDMVEAAGKRLESQLNKALENDAWRPKIAFQKSSLRFNEIRDPVLQELEPAPDGTTSGVQATSSVAWLATMLGDFMNGVCNVLELQLVHTLSTTLSSILENVMAALLRAENGRENNDGQRLCILSNGVVIAKYIVPRLIAQAESCLECKLAEMRGLLRVVGKGNAALQSAFCSTIAADVVGRGDVGGLDWPGTDYHTERAPEDVFVPQQKFSKLGQFAQNLMGSVARALHPDAVEAIARTFLEAVARELARDGTAFWKTNSGNVSKAGLRQLLLDMRFFTALGGSLLSDAAIVSIESVVQRVVAANASSGFDVAAEEEWAQQRVKAAMTKEKPLLGVLSSIVAASK